MPLTLSKFAIIDIKRKPKYQVMFSFIMIYGWNEIQNISSHKSEAKKNKATLTL